MPVNKKKDIQNLLIFLREHSDAVSNTGESAMEYLKEQGKKPEPFMNKLLKKIKKTQLETNAMATGNEFSKFGNLRETAIQKAKELLNSKGFSFLDFMKKEKFSLQNKNLEHLNSEEIQSILEDYLFLKMQNNNSDNNGDS